MKMLVRYFTPDDKITAFLLGGFAMLAATLLPPVAELAFLICFSAFSLGYGIRSVIKMMRRDA